MKEGTFPQQLKLGTRSVGWLESEIESWIAACIDNRDK
jgi:prophage regulatory protein